MGADKNERRKTVRAKSLFSTNTSNDGVGFDWSEQDEHRLHRLIVLVTSRGGAIRFGYSRDGQAGSIGIYYGESRDTLWLRPNGDDQAVYERVESTFNELTNTNGRSPE